MKRAFKIACLAYKNNTVKHHNKEYTRTELMEMRRNIVQEILLDHKVAVQDCDEMEVTLMKPRPMINLGMVPS